MKSNLKDQIFKLLNKSGNKTLIWFDNQYFELIKGEMKPITEVAVQKLMSNPDCHVMAFRTNEKQFSFDTCQWQGPELEPLPEQLEDKENVISYEVDSIKSVEAILRLRKVFAK